jgi:hypothetical protein
MLHLVAANEPYSGNMGGLSGADFVCYNEAKAAGMSGTFRAFLASHVQDIDSIVHRHTDRSIPVVNSRHQELFSSWSDIFTGSGATFSSRVPIYSFSGRDVLVDPTWPQKLVWLGANSRGERLDGDYCDGWNNNEGQMTGSASALLPKYRLMSAESSYACNNAFILLCIENSYSRND